MEARDAALSHRDAIRLSRSVRGWLCRLGLHSWKVRSVVGHFGTTRYTSWSIYEECSRCGDERSFREENANVVAAIQEALDA